MLLAASVLALAWLLFVGFAACILCFNRLTARAFLLAPAIGTAICLIALLTASRLDFTIRQTAWPIAIALTIASGLIFYLRRRQLLEIERTEIVNAAVGCGICVAAMVISGWPILLYGPNWISFGNDDMVNYCLGAMRLLDHYYYQVPNPTDFAQGRDLPTSYFFLHVMNRERIGAELLLAFVSKIFGLIPFSAFMSLMLILHGSVIAGIGAIVPRAGGARIIAMVAMSFSALESLGVEYQLLGQEMGISLLLVSAALLAIQFTEDRHLRVAALTGIVVTGILIGYPEIMLFLVAGAAFFLARLLIRRVANLRSVALQTAVTSAVALVLLNGQITQVIVLLLERSQSTKLTSSAVNIGLFPYYLLPSGAANLFGVVPVGFFSEGLIMSLVVGLGFLALIVILLLLVDGIRRGEMSASILLAMVLLAIPLYHSQAGFPLYKLAMYAQAPIIATWACAVAGMRLPFLRRASQRVAPARTATA